MKMSAGTFSPLRLDYRGVQSLGLEEDEIEVIRLVGVGKNLTRTMENGHLVPPGLTDAELRYCLRGLAWIKVNKGEPAMRKKLAKVLSGELRILLPRPIYAGDR